MTGECCILGKSKHVVRSSWVSFFYKSRNSAVKNHEAEKADITWMQSVLCVPDSDAVAVEILLS